jgi:hypothetical protein
MPDAGRNRTCAAPSPAQAAPSQDRANYKEAAEVSKDETRYNPGDVFRDREKAKIASRKERFAKLNRYVTERHGWLTSIPGAREVELQTLPDSTLPGDLERLGYRLEEIGETERILPSRHHRALCPRCGRGISPDHAREHQGRCRDPAACWHRQGEALRLRDAVTIFCCWRNSGKHLLAARISHFDPEPTFSEWLLMVVFGAPAVYDCIIDEMTAYLTWQPWLTTTAPA